MIIDTHAHIYPRFRPLWQRPGDNIQIITQPYGKREVLGSPEPIREGSVPIPNPCQFIPPSFEHTSSPPEVLLGYMDMAGVDMAVLLQAPVYGNWDDYVADACRTWPDRFIGPVGYCRPSFPRDEALFQCEEKVAKLKSEMAFRL